MAKIVVTADTETKELLVNVDGEEQQNVRSVHMYVYQGYDKPGEMELNVGITMEENQDNGVTKITNLIAKQSTEGKKALEKGALVCAKHRDFVILGDSNKLKRDIAERFFPNL